MFKTLQKENVNIRTFKVHKTWSFDESTISDGEIIIQSGISSSGAFYPLGQSTNDDGTYKKIIYDSIKHLYYNTSNNYNNVLINIDNIKYISRSIEDEISVLNIPSNLFGERIFPGSITITSASIEYSDDSNCNLKTEGGLTVGNVFYDTGHIVITSGSNIDMFNSFDILFKNVVLINEYEVQCESTPSEHAYSTNMTAYDNSGSYLDIFSGSEFRPYITTIGLYSDDNELIALGKLPRPIQKDNKFNLSFMLRFDL